MASTTRPSTWGLTAQVKSFRSKSTMMARLMTSPTRISVSLDGTIKPSPFVCLTAMRSMCGSTTSTMAGRIPITARRLTVHPSAKTWVTTLTITHGSLSDRAERLDVMVHPDRLEVGTCLPPPPGIFLDKKVCYGHGLSFSLSLLIKFAKHTLYSSTLYTIHIYLFIP